MILPMNVQQITSIKPTTIHWIFILLAGGLLLKTEAILLDNNESILCSENEFQCKNGFDCIHPNLTCNGVPECKDGSDEAVVLCGCLEREFECLDRCIPEMHRCDTKIDCDEGEDEKNCETWHCLSSHFKCLNGFCIPSDSVCDFIDDCKDGSDEQHCDHRKCYFKEFNCDNGECIRPGLICDGSQDCVDGSDEKNCSIDDFAVCESGKKIHRYYWCDGWPECQDNHADETICGPCSNDEFRCDDNQCISLGNVCDAQCDCSNCTDENDCQNFYTKRSGIAECITGVTVPCIVRPENRALDRCIAEDYICDGFNHCHNGFQLGDESDCVMESDIFCGEFEEEQKEHFRCPGEGRCLPVDVKCDFKIDCLHGDDEFDCEYRACGSEEWRCGSGECVPIEAVCNLSFECHDKTDEMDCEDEKCDEDEVKCLSGQCLKRDLWCDHYPDCPDQSDELNCENPHGCSKSEFACADGRQCIRIEDKCVVLSDRKNRCADGSHLLNCEDFVCQTGMHKCHSGPCLNVSRKCDGFIDCPDTWDDENNCPFACSLDEPGCRCYHLEADCSQLELKNLPLIEPQINRYNLSGNRLNASLKTDFFNGRTNLVHIDLTNNGIEHLPKGVFASLWRLRILILKNNRISQVNDGAFLGLLNLRTLNLEGNGITLIGPLAFSGLSMLSTLDLSNQNLYVIKPKAFVGLRNLTTLTLSGNILTELHDTTFQGLQKLRQLNIKDNFITTVSSQTFSVLPKIEKLITDERRWCCLASFVEECLPPADEFSSCEDLMSSTLLRICIWILGTIALAGNFFVIVWRSIYTSGNKLHSFLIVNLAIGDFLMGAYLIIIASVDIHFRGIYATEEQKWRKSLLCRFAGFCSTLSSELSVFTLTVITVDRLISIKFPFGSRHYDGPGTKIVMALVWILVAALAAFPLAPLEYFSNFYGRSGVCLALHITTEKHNGWEYAVFIFLVLNFLSFTIIAISYILMYTTAKSTRTAARTNEEKDGSKSESSSASMAKRMTLIVVTDAACWLPIIALSIASLLGMPTPPKVYAWVAVFVLPLNAAVNPVLYTLSTAPVRKKLLWPWGSNSSQNLHRKDLFRGSMSCSHWKTSMKSHVTVIETDGTSTETRLLSPSCVMGQKPKPNSCKWNVDSTAFSLTPEPAIQSNGMDYQKDNKKAELIPLSELTRNSEITKNHCSVKKKICDIDKRYD